MRIEQILNKGSPLFLTISLFAALLAGIKNIAGSGVKGCPAVGPCCWKSEKTLG